MKRVVIPIEFCNDCRYSVLMTFRASQTMALFCEKQQRTLIDIPGACGVPPVEVPEDCPLPDFKE